MLIFLFKKGKRQKCYLTSYLTKKDKIEFSLENILN